MDANQDPEKKVDPDNQNPVRQTEPSEISFDKAEADTKPSGPAADEWEFVTGYKLFVIFGTVTLVAFTLLLDTSIIVTAIPSITTDFHSLDDVGWYGSSYLLASTCLQLPAGKLYQQLSSKWTFLAFLGIFELGSLLCGVSQSSKMLIVARAVAGLGASGLMNGALTIIANCIPLHQRATYMGMLMSCAQIGILLGPLIGGALTQYTTWRWCFYINLPIGGLAAIILTLITIPDRTSLNPIKPTFKSVMASFDLIGFSLFAPTVIMLLLALQWGGADYAWGSATIIGLFCGSAGLLVVFLAWEYHKGELAMVRLSMLKNRIVWCACLTIFFLFGIMMTTSYYLPIYFQAVRGATPTLSGVYMLPSILSQMIMATVSGVLVGKLGYYLPWALLSGVLNGIGAGLLSRLTPASSTGEWIGYQILGGLGRGCGMQMPLVAISAFLTPAENPIGMALCVFCQTFGGAIWLALAQTDFSSSLQKALPEYAPSVSPALVTAAGATGFRTMLPKADVPGVIESYSVSVNHIFYMAAGMAGGVFIFAWGLGWVSVKKPKVVQPEA